MARKIFAVATSTKYTPKLQKAWRTNNWDSDNSLGSASENQSSCTNSRSSRSSCILIKFAYYDKKSIN